MLVMLRFSVCNFAKTQVFEAYVGLLLLRKTVTGVVNEWQVYFSHSRGIVFNGSIPGIGRQILIQ